MGTCKYCTKSTGLFSSFHKECEEKHSNACSELKAIFADYFKGTKSQQDISNALKKKSSECYVKNEDIAHLADEALSCYEKSLHRPFSASILGIATDFIKVTGISYSEINSKGALDNIATKLMKGFIADYFTDVLSLDKALSRCQRVTATFPLNSLAENNVYMEMLEKASSNYLKDGTLSSIEKGHIDEYVKRLGLQVSNLPAKYQDSDIAKVGQAAVLRDLERGGVYPVYNIQLPVILAKNEHVIWTYNDVSMYMEKIERETVGRSGGFSFRVAKGVTYRVGQFRGHPVEHSRMNLEGNGVLIVTNKNLIFYSTQRNNKVPFNKIIGVTPYSDGIEVHKDGNAKRLTFVGFDSWLIMNLLSMVTNI